MADSGFISFKHALNKTGLSPALKITAVRDVKPFHGTRIVGARRRLDPCPDSLPRDFVENARFPMSPGKLPSKLYPKSGDTSHFQNHIVLLFLPFSRRHGNVERNACFFSFVFSFLIAFKSTDRVICFGNRRVISDVTRIGDISSAII